MAFEILEIGPVVWEISGGGALWAPPPPPAGRVTNQTPAGRGLNYNTFPLIELCGFSERRNQIGVAGALLGRFLDDTSWLAGFEWNCGFCFLLLSVTAVFAVHVNAYNKCHKTVLNKIQKRKKPIYTQDNRVPNAVAKFTHFRNPALIFMASFIKMRYSVFSRS